MHKRLKPIRGGPLNTEYKNNATHTLANYRINKYTKTTYKTKGTLVKQIITEP